MKDVYEKNPQMGDPGSLQPKLAETTNNIDRLRMEIHKNEVDLLLSSCLRQSHLYKFHYDRQVFARIIFNF